MPANATVKATITDTYTVPAPGSLIVHKTISGEGAGKQGPITIHVVCDETPDSLTPDWVIPAGTTAGTVAQTYENIPAGAVCTVTEIVNGTNSSVQVTVDGSGAATTVPTGSSATAELTDDYSLLPGSLLVQKSITGDAAGRQGAITIHVVCNETPPTARLGDPGRHEGGNRLEDVRRHPGGRDLHGDGDRQGGHSHRQRRRHRRR